MIVENYYKTNTVLVTKLTKKLADQIKRGTWKIIPHISRMINTYIKQHLFKKKVLKD